MAKNRPRDQMLDIADHVEALLLRGFTTARQVQRNSKQFDMGLLEAQQYIDHVHRRWGRGQSRQDRDTKRAAAVQMHMAALRQAYDVIAEARNSGNPAALGERNRAVGNIVRILSQIADLEGLKERTVRVGGDRDNIPVKVHTESTTTHALVLDSLMQQGYIDATAFAAIESAIVQGHGELDGPQVVEGLRQIDAGSGGSAPSPGDYSGGRAGEPQ